MRQSFYEYYELSEKEFDRLWKEAIVVFDTNVLLSLYRLPIDARNEILAVMKELNSRLWLPFQVGYEFHEHRLEEATRPIESLKSFADKFEKFNGEIENAYGRNPYIPNFKYVKDRLKSLHSRMDKKVIEWIADCPDMLHEDTVLKELSTLYEGKVGDAYNESKLQEIYNEGKIRYENEVPPGYKDKIKSTGDRHKYGDLIIWFQIIEKSQKSNCDVIFVTDDEKEDWWYTYKGNILGPRRELISEFRKKTSEHLIGFYTTERFLFYVKRERGLSVKTRTIEEVKRPAIDLRKYLEQSVQPGQVSVNTDRSYPFISLDESGQPNWDFSSMFNHPLEGISIKLPPVFDYDALSSLGKTRYGQAIKTVPVSNESDRLGLKDGTDLNIMSSDEDTNDNKDNNDDNQTE